MSEKSHFKSCVKPLEIEAGEKLSVYCEYSGPLLHGFFDLALIVDEKYWLWFPDENSWNPWRDTGVLSGAGPFRTEWAPFVQDWVPEGEYEVLALVYDDKEGKNIDRKPISQQRFKIKIYDSKHPDAAFVRELYKRFLDRKPDIAGYRVWFVNLQIVKAEKRQVLEIGFLRSPEFRVRFIHEFLTKENISGDELNSSVQTLMNYPISRLLKEKYQQHISNLVDFHTRVIEFLKIKEKGLGFHELLKIEEGTDNPMDKLDAIINNFLLEKYILVRYLFPELSNEATEEKVEMYLRFPQKIVNEI